jgi:hypothetical protein
MRTKLYGYELLVFLLLSYCNVADITHSLNAIGAIIFVSAPRAVKSSLP